MSTYVSYCGDEVTAEFTWSDYQDITFIGSTEPGDWFDGHFYVHTALSPTGDYWEVRFIDACEDDPYDRDDVDHRPCFIGPRPA